MNKLMVIGLIILAAMLSSCIVVESDCPEVPATPEPAQPAAPATPHYDLFENDVLGMIDRGEITGGDVSVDGVALGDSFPQAVDKAGYPQFIDEFIDGEVLNAKYENENGTTKYILHFENSTLTRIVIRDTTPGLIGVSQIGMNLSSITSRFGKPDLTEDNAGAKVGFRTYYYYNLGLEIYHQRKEMIGYAFVVPREPPADLEVPVYNTDYHAPVSP